MEPMLPDFLAAARTLTFSPPAIPVISNLTGQLAGDEIQTPEYWADHIRRTVRFSDGITALARAGVTAYIELGPDSTLTAATLDTLDDPAALVIPALRKDTPEPDTLLTALAQMHTHGIDINWAALDPQPPRPHHQLPTYPFQQHHYWHDAASMGTQGRPRWGWTAPTTRCWRRWSGSPMPRTWCSPAGCRAGRHPGSPTTW